MLWGDLDASRLATQAYISIRAIPSECLAHTSHAVAAIALDGT